MSSIINLNRKISSSIILKTLDFVKTQHVNKMNKTRHQHLFQGQKRIDRKVNVSFSGTDKIKNLWENFENLSQTLPDLQHRYENPNNNKKSQHQKFEVSFFKIYIVSLPTKNWPQSGVSTLTNIKFCSLQ